MKKIVILFCFIISCQNQKLDDKTIIDENFKNILIEYINENSIKNINLNNYNNKLPVSSYQVFFDKVENDTIISVKLSPFLVGLNPFYLKNNKDTIQEFQNSLGYFIFRDKSIIIFDDANYGINILETEKLISVIPDSLKWDFGKVNTHLKSQSKFYKMTKSNIIELN